MYAISRENFPLIRPCCAALIILGNKKYINILYLCQHNDVAYN